MFLCHLFIDNETAYFLNHPVLQLLSEQAPLPPGLLHITACEDRGMTCCAFLHKADNISSPCYAVLQNLRCSWLNLRSERATLDRDVLEDSEMRLADGQELEDWQGYAYIDILKYESLWTIRANVAGLQQSGSHSVKWIPLSDVLHNMLQYAEDQKRAKEPQDFDRVKSAVVQGPANLAYVTPVNLEEPGQTLCVGASRKFSAQGLAHSTLHILSF